MLPSRNHPQRSLLRLTNDVACEKYRPPFARFPRFRRIFPNSCFKEVICPAGSTHCPPLLPPPPPLPPFWLLYCLVTPCLLTVINEDPAWLQHCGEVPLGSLFLVLGRVHSPASSRGCGRAGRMWGRRGSCAWFDAMLLSFKDSLYILSKGGGPHFYLALGPPDDVGGPGWGQEERRPACGMLGIQRIPTSPCPQGPRRPLWVGEGGDEEPAAPGARVQPPPRLCSHSGLSPQLPAHPLRSQPGSCYKCCFPSDRPDILRLCSSFLLLLIPKLLAPPSGCGGDGTSTHTRRSLRGQGLHLHVRPSRWPCFPAAAVGPDLPHRDASSLGQRECWKVDFH